MLRKIIMTADGSHSIEVPELNVTYHSIHGAIQESKHVFIQAGLIDSKVFDYAGVHQILEIGFGTGLNALLTLIEADMHTNRIYYTGIELHPLHETQVNQLNYSEQLNLPQYQPLFEKMHKCEWNEMVEITEYFRFTKVRSDLKDFSAENRFFLIYFDAFAPAAQPELWAKEIFDKMYSMLLPEGILVTYCSKGEVRRAMQTAGFKVEKLPGPRGKREMTRATKKISSPAE